MFLLEVFTTTTPPPKKNPSIIFLVKSKYKNDDEIALFMNAEYTLLKFVPGSVLL